MRLLPVALVLLAAPAPAAAQDMCAALDRLAAASREPVPFASLGRAFEEGEAVIPGFRSGDCRITPEAVSCDVNDFDAGIFDGWPDPLPCPGLSPVTASGRGPGRRDWQRTYVMSGLRIEYGISCLRCAGGTPSYFSAAVEPRRRRED